MTKLLNSGVWFKTNKSLKQSKSNSPKDFTIGRIVLLHRHFETDYPDECLSQTKDNTQMGIVFFVTCQVLLTSSHQRSRGIPNLTVFGSFCFYSSYLAHFGTNDTRAFLRWAKLTRVARLSPKGTDPDRTVVTSAWGNPRQRDLTNPQTFYFTSTLCPNAEGFESLFFFAFSFLDYVAPVFRYFTLVEHSNWGVPNLPIVAHMGALALQLYNECQFDSSLTLMWGSSLTKR